MATTTHAACGGEIEFDPDVQSGPGSLSDAISKHRCAKPAARPNSIDDIELTFQLGGSAWNVTGAIRGDEVIVDVWHDQTRVDRITEALR